MSYSTKTIKYVLDQIKEKNFVLPAIQREFVWEAQQIEKLFDSLMRGYPIGSFLFWNIKAKNIKEYEFYEFILKYHSKDHRHNPKFETKVEKDITAILDGQQRLTSLCIGLFGSYTEKRKNVRETAKNAFPEKTLYLNLLPKLNDNSEDEEYQDMLYEFKFLTTDEVEKVDKLEKFWFKIGDILKIEPADYLIDELDHLEKSEKRIVLQRLTHLKSLIEEKPLINYFEENEQDLDKVLNIFVRTNSGGTKLSYSDLLLTTATALWSKYNARKEIHDLVDSLNEKGMKISTDFVMKSSLMLTDLKVKFLVKNFNRTNMEHIESQWESIKTYLILSVDFLRINGYNNQYIPAYNALLPIAYYLKISEVDPDKFLRHNKYSSDRKILIKWLRRAFIKQVFGGSSDGTLTLYRETIKKHYSNGFPFEELEKKFKGKHGDISLNDEDIKELLNNTHYSNKKQLFSVMTSIFTIPNHALDMSIDHMYPRSSFTDKNLSAWGFKTKEDREAVYYWQDHISNLQYLEISHNQAKSAQGFKKWLEEQDDDFKTLQIVPKIESYDPSNFITFCEKRYNLLLAKLKKNI
ncbi:MAG: DUF262 domain-containing protein [Brevinema sp.]